MAHPQRSVASWVIKACIDLEAERAGKRDDATKAGKEPPPPPPPPAAGAGGDRHLNFNRAVVMR